MEKSDNTYTVIVSAAATQMLISHSQFLAQVNEQAALNLIDEFQEKTKSLEFMPERNPWLEDPNLIPGKYHKLQMGKWHLIIYQIKSNTVFVDYVIDCRRDYHWLL